MYSQNLFVFDFMRRFFVSCVEIFEAYVVRTLIKFGCDWRKISHKSKCRKTPIVHQIRSPSFLVALLYRRTERVYGFHFQIIFFVFSHAKTPPEPKISTRERRFSVSFLFSETSCLPVQLLSVPESKVKPNRVASVQ